MAGGLKTMASRRTTVLFLNVLALTAVVVWVAQGPKGYQVLPQSVIGAPGHTTATPTQPKASASRKPKPLSVKSPTPTSATGQACHFTNVDAFDSAIIKKVKKYPPINCKAGRPWLVYREGSYLKVNATKVEASSKAKNFSHCQYRTLTKSSKNDHGVIYGAWSKRFNTSIKVEPGSTFVEAICYNKSKSSISNSYFPFLSLTHETHDESHISRYVNHLKRFAPRETLNVMLVGIDGLSKQNCERSMPLMRNFLLRNLSGIELQKYNKVGLNTFPNVLPLLTGHHVGYYKRLNWTLKEPFDKIGKYFVWSEYAKAGYRTALHLEEKYITSFHYLKKGFYKSPVDYYTRPMILTIDGNKKLNTAGKFCKGDNPSIAIHNDFMHELATKFKSPTSPYFAYSFLTRLTHDDQNRASSGDELYLSFLKKLKDENALNNTILILFSDHGERFGSIRRTYNGIIEAKSPAGFIVVPEWFKTKYPEEHKRLQTNAGRLTSVFDLHATLKDILYFKSDSQPKDLFPGPGISLFSGLIPESRTCNQSGIPAEYCNCNTLRKVNVTKETGKIVSSAITEMMMKALGDLTKNKCHKLEPKSIQSILEKGRPADRLKSIISDSSVFYHVTVATTPGHGIFEAVVEYKTTKKEAQVVGTISRLDMYKGEKECITDATVRSFCYCQ